MSTVERRPDTLFIQPAGALGDTLLAYPAVAALRAWAPKARLTLAARGAYGAFALSAAIVDQVVDVDGYSLSRGGVGAPIPYDLAVVWSSAFREAARRFEEQGIITIIAAPPLPSDARHQARYLLDCLRPLGIPRTLRAAPPPALVPLSLREEALLGQNEPTVVLHPGAGALWKQWPIASWLALSDALRTHGMTVRWSQGPDDEKVRDALLSLRPALLTELWPLQPLPRFAALLARCRLFVSADTGTAHLAALLRVPQVVLFGPTDPRRWRPISRVALPVRSPDICGGKWDIAGGTMNGPPGLRRCLDQQGSGCSCLAALPVEAIARQSLQIMQGRA